MARHGLGRCPHTHNRTPYRQHKQRASEHREGTWELPEAPQSRRGSWHQSARAAVTTHCTLSSPTETNCLAGLETGSLRPGREQGWCPVRPSCPGVRATGGGSWKLSGFEGLRRLWEIHSFPIIKHFSPCPHFITKDQRGQSTGVS